MAEDDNDAMQDGATSEGEGKGKGKGKSPSLPIARAIARTLWVAEFKTTQPEASTADLNAAWKAVRQERSKPVMQALKSLEKRGYSFTAPAGADAEDGDLSDPAA